MNQEEIKKNKRARKEMENRIRLCEILEQKGWIRIPLPIKNMINGYYEVGIRYTEQEEWCVANIPNTKGRRWRVGAFLHENEFYFENVEDALLFKVTWQ